VLRLGTIDYLSALRTAEEVCGAPSYLGAGQQVSPHALGRRLLSCRNRSDDPSRGRRPQWVGGMKGDALSPVFSFFADRFSLSVLPAGFLAAALRGDFPATAGLSGT